MPERLNLKKYLGDFISNTMKNELKRYEYAGKKAAKEIREGIVNRWFGEFNSDSVNDSTMYVAHSQVFKNLTAQVTIDSYVDYDYYQDYYTKYDAAKWRERNPEFAGNWEPEYYVLVHLQMVEGIIGLPKRGKRRLDYPEYTRIGGGIILNGHWENENFHQREYGLRDEIFNKDNWAQWDMLVSKYANNK